MEMKFIKVDKNEIEIILDITSFDAIKEFLKSCTDKEIFTLRGISPPKSVSDEDFSLLTKFGNFVGFEFGVRMKWWEDWDKKQPIPFPVMVDKEVMLSQNVKFMSQLLVRLEIFPSVSEAKKAGWNKPIEVGEFFVKHDGFKRTRIIVE